MPSAANTPQKWGGGSGKDSGKGGAASGVGNAGGAGGSGGAEEACETIVPFVVAPGDEDAGDRGAPVLDCVNLTVLTPDGTRALVGGMPLSGGLPGSASYDEHARAIKAGRELATGIYRGINFSVRVV